jgi:hypothetical protein
MGWLWIFGGREVAQKGGKKWRLIFLVKNWGVKDFRRGDVEGIFSPSLLPSTG